MSTGQLLSHQRHIPRHALRLVAGGGGRVNDFINVGALFCRVAFVGSVPASVDVGGLENELAPAVVNGQVVSLHQVIALHGLEFVI